MNKLLLLSPMLLLAGCGGGGEYRIDAPSILEPGKPVKVTLTGKVDASAKVSWSAPMGGRFEGAVDQFIVTFIPPDSGSAKLVCTISWPAAKTQVVDKDITVGGPAAANTPPPAASTAAAAAPAHPLNIEDAAFVPSGFMGDIKALKVNARSMVQPHSPPYCQKWSYIPTPGGDVDWAAVAWQFPERNDGDQPGKTLSSSFRQVSVWARGVADSHGTFPKVQFKAGGNTKSGARYNASFEVVGDFETLTSDWTEYHLDLQGKNLSNVATAFIFVVKAQDVGPQGATFYLDDIVYR